MTPLSRRALLRGLGAAVLLPALSGAAPQLDGLWVAFRAAQRAGRPLLVLVFTEDGADDWTRGELWGAVLNHGRDTTLATLATVDLVCASVGALAQLVPHARFPRDFAAALIDTATLPSTVTSVSLGPGSPRTNFRMDPDGDAQFDAQALGLEDAVTALIVGDAATLNGRLSQAERAGPAAVAAAQASLPSPSLEAVATAPIVFLQAASRSGGRDVALLGLLAEVARQRHVAGAVAGARWAFSMGCGVSFEGDEDALRARCGMGHVPEKARRFLSYWREGG